MLFHFQLYTTAFLNDAAEWYHQLQVSETHLIAYFLVHAIFLDVEQPRGLNNNIYAEITPGNNSRIYLLEYLYPLAIDNK